MKTLKDTGHLEGVKVLVRADFNVPVLDGKVVDDFRVRAALPTIEYLRGRGATVIIVSHLESTDHDNPSLEPVARHLRSLDGSVEFVRDWKKAREEIDGSAGEPMKGEGEKENKAGRVFLLENLRFFEGEKKNDRKFAEELASLADIYVNDAFSVSHREHASIVGVPKLIPGYAGLQLEKEVAGLSKAFNPAHPFVFILGGAKFETKLPLLRKFTAAAETVFVGGALANDFYKRKGYEVGVSAISDGKTDISGLLEDPKILIPPDVTNQRGEIKAADGLSTDDKIMDAGPRTTELLREKLSSARFILWNGPLGMYEDGYRGPTLELAKMIAERTVAGAESVIGGGGTVAAVETLGIKDKFTFVSTGGGAMLDFLAKGTLPGIEALENCAE